MNLKKIFIAIMVLLQFSVSCFVVDGSLNKSYAAMPYEQNSIAQEVVSAEGYGMLAEGVPYEKAKIMARRAAVVDAQRNLLEIVKGTAVTSETTINNFTVVDDTIKTKVNGLIVGAKVVEENFFDGIYRVKMEIPMYGAGSLAEVAIDGVRGNSQVQAVPEPNNEFMKSYQNNNVGYTGLVIDARNSEIVRTYCPAIFDESGRAVYGVYNVDKDYAISNGVVEYAEGTEFWSRVDCGNSRAGSNPLVIKIVGLRPRVVNKCDVVISVADADKILAENIRSGFLNRYAVVIEK